MTVKKKTSAVKKKTTSTKKITPKKKIHDDTDDNKNDTSPFEALNFEENAAQFLKQLSFCVFDLETTGGNHKVDKIIEIGIVKITNLKIVEEKNYLIQPEIKIPEFIQKLTSITPKDVADAPLIEDVIDEILVMMSDSILVAHNTSFDIPFFNSVLKRLNRPLLENKAICTNLMTKYLIPNLMNSNLNYMCRIFDISHKKAHRALDDARATAHLLLKYLNIFIYKDIKKLNHLYYPRNRYELDRMHFKNEHSDSKIIAVLQKLSTPALITFKGENGVILFSLPVTKSPETVQYVQEYITDLSWEICTIRLYGTLLEAFIHYAALYAKIDPQVRSQTISFLEKKYLKNNSGALKKEKDPLQLIEKTDFIGDFAISKHLVPEQLIIWPLSSLKGNSELIFRYPGHKKKLLQYINSKSARLINNKIKKTNYPVPMKEFLDSYLKNEKTKNKSLLIFDKSLPQKRPEDFFQKIDELLTKNPNSYHYPREYI